METVQLTQDQKRLIVEYHLHLNKGIFEDCPEFWNNLTQEQIDDLYPAYKLAAGKFMAEIKEHLLSII